MDGRNIVITGFMGTGKTTVAQEVARRLGAEAVDMDQLIEARESLSIAEIFASQGEAAFRKLEAELCQELAKGRGLVIATGGGALVSSENRATFAKEGAMMICLDCSPEEVLRRVGEMQDRPLLAADDKLERIQELMAQRQEAYNKIPFHIDTTYLSGEVVAERVLALYRERPESIPVQTPQGGYEILLGEGLLARAGPLMAERGLGPRIAIVATPPVGKLYAARLVESLDEADLKGSVVEMPDGEQYKTLETLRGLYERFVELELDRGSVIVALGGGVVGDVAGLAAATYMRGLPLVQAPTTLLAMVDSSVGGKVAVDLPQGKNLVGAFKEPSLVLTDTGVLGTLPEAEFRSGLAEVIKHGLIASPPLFQHLEERGVEEMGWILREAIQVKVAVVEEDPLEKGRRAVLNLGHTFGHALEALSGYGMRHGEAVSVGLVAAAGVAHRLGLCPLPLQERIAALLRRFGLPTSYRSFEPQEVFGAMATDKKRRGGKLRFVLPKGIGEVLYGQEVPDEVVLAELEELRE